MLCMLFHKLIVLAFSSLKRLKLIINSRYVDYCRPNFELKLTSIFISLACLVVHFGENLL